MRLEINSVDDFRQSRKDIRMVLHDLFPEDMSFEVAVNEAINNAFWHGAKEVLFPINILCRWNDDEMKVVVRDYGPGFDVEKWTQEKTKTQEKLRQAAHNLAENGRGIWMMQEMCDEILFSKGGQEVTLIKNRL